MPLHLHMQISSETVFNGLSKYLKAEMYEEIMCTKQSTTVPNIFVLEQTFSSF